MLETTEAASAPAALHLLPPPPPAPSTVPPIDRSQQRWLRPPSARRRGPRTSPLASSSSSGFFDPGQEDGFRTAYDAYHEATVTLDPLVVHGGIFPPRRSGPSTAGGEGADGDDRPPGEQPSTGRGSRRFAGALYPGGCRLPLQLVHLDYQDFAPTLSGFDDSGNLGCSETFADLVCRANDWLRQNPQMAVKTCETITWSTSRVTEVGDTENMMQQCDPLWGHQLCDEDVYFFSGLRVWVIPKKLSSSVSSGSSVVGWNGHRIEYRDYNPTTRNSLSHFVARVNDDLTKRPLQGRVNAVEAVLVPEFLSADTGCLFWKRTPNEPRRSVAFLRIFYHPDFDRPTESIGLKVMLPENVDCGYEPFSALFARAVQWARKQPHWTRVTNFKSYNIPCSGSSLDKDANGCVHPSFDDSVGSPAAPPPPQTTTTPGASSFPRQQCFQVLRIFYVRSPRSPGPADDGGDAKTTAVEDEEEAATVHRQRPRGEGDAAAGDRRPASGVRCAVFSPVRTSADGRGVRTTFERMKQTTLKISAWMIQNAIEIHSVETYTSPLLPSTEIQSLPEMTSWLLHVNKSVAKCLSNEKRSLMHIRVYFESRTDPTVVHHPDLQESEEHSRQPFRQQRSRERRSPPPPPGWKASQPPPPPEPCVIVPVTTTVLPVAVETALIEEQRKLWEKRRRWRSRKLRLAMTCILMLAISIPTGVLFYFNAVQTPG